MFYLLEGAAQSRRILKRPHGCNTTLQRELHIFAFETCSRKDDSQIINGTW